MTFTGFEPDAVALLAELPDWDSDRYAAERSRLAAGVTRPGLALITHVADHVDADLMSPSGVRSRRCTATCALPRPAHPATRTISS